MCLKRKMCECSLHDSLAEEGENQKIFILDDGKKVKSATKQMLISENAIGPKCKYICEKCVAHFEKEVPKCTISDEVKLFIEGLNTYKYSNSEQELIVGALGRNISCT
jgi:hypothetical protein